MSRDHKLLFQSNRIIVLGFRWRALLVKHSWRVYVTLLMQTHLPAAAHWQEGSQRAKWGNRYTPTIKLSSSRGRLDTELSEDKSCFKGRHSNMIRTWEMRKYVTLNQHLLLLLFFYPQTAWILCPYSVTTRLRPFSMKRPSWTHSGQSRLKQFLFGVLLPLNCFVSCALGCGRFISHSSMKTQV